MQVKIKALVLSYTPVGDHDLVLRTFTEHHGKLSFFVHRYKSKKSGIKTSLLMPMMPLEIETTLKTSNDLQKLSEAKALHSGHQIYNHPYKLAQCYFMAEMLQNLHFEASNHEDFFDYVFQILVAYDQGTELDAMLPIHWLISLMGEMGLRPVSTQLEYPYYFDIKEAEFQSYEPIHPHFWTPDLSYTFNQLLTKGEYKLNQTFRSQLLQGLLDFLQVHATGFRPPKSLQVYSEMLG